MSGSINRVLKKRENSKVSQKDFINSFAASEIVEASNLHIKFMTFLIFRKKAENNSIKCQKMKKHLKTMCALYGLNILLTDNRHCFECGYFQGQAAI